MGPSYRTLNFVSKCVNITHINAIWKIIENQILHGSLFYCLKNLKTIINFKNESITSNILSTILLIVRSFVKIFKRYCMLEYKWFVLCRFKLFLHRFSQRFSHPPTAFRYLPRLKCCLYHTFGKTLGG